MKQAISAIRVENVRGIRYLHLPLGGSSSILVGENGSGKSSVVDALEYFFTGHVTHLEGRQDVRARDSFPHINGGSPEITLEWDLADSSVQVQTTYPRQSMDIPTSLRAFFDAAGSRAFILHRAQLLDFINARDSERYARISDLIGLADLDKVDQTWRAQLNDVRKKHDEARNRLRMVASQLAQLLGVDKVGSDTDIVEGLNHHLARLDVSPVEELADVPGRIDAVQRRCQSTQEQQQWEQLRVARARVTELKEQTRALVSAYSRFKESMDRLLDLTASLEEGHLEGLLREAATVLASAPVVQSCPLCEAPIEDVAELLGRVRFRLNALTELTECRREVERHKQQLTDSVKTWVAGLSWLSEVSHELEYADLLQSLDDLRHVGIAWQQVLRGDSSSDKLNLQLDEDTRLAALTKQLTSLGQAIDQRFADLAPDETQRTAFEVLSVLTRVEDPWRSYRSASRSYRVTGFTVSQVETVYEHIVQARIRGLKRIASALEDDFAYLYGQLHPDEGCGRVELSVQEDRRASVGLRAGFHDRDPVHPLNYFSEGHLDSLGLCIFLAFIRRFNGDFHLMVLDDIWTAVDAGHRLRVARLLADEFADYQMIVTTHDRLWAEQLNIILPNAKVYRLKPWTLENGTCCQETPPSDWDYYWQQVDDGRLQDAIAGVGRNLEQFLYHMRSNLGIAVPAKPNEDYTIGDLYGPFFKWIKGCRPIEREDWSSFDDDVQTMQTELDTVWRLRNWSGAHFNEWAVQVSAREALAFLDAVERLVKAFSCPVCGALVVYNEDSHALMCPNCRPSPSEKPVSHYSVDWQSAAERMLDIGRRRALAGIGPMLTAALKRFLADLLSRMPEQAVDGAITDTALVTRFAAFLAWAKQHPRQGVEQWTERIETFAGLLEAYWPEVEPQAMPDEEKPEIVRVVGDFTNLFTCPACATLLSYDLDQGGYVCGECDRQSETPDKMSAFWYTGRG